MKRIQLLLICAAIFAFSTTASADIVLQYDSIGEFGGNSGEGQLGTYNVDSAFVSNPLSFIGSDGTTVQGVGSVAQPQIRLPVVTSSSSRLTLPKHWI